MRAAYIEEHGGPEVLKVCERPDPEPGPGDALVQVEACGLNHLDIWVRLGGKRPFPLPLIPGSDPAGIVLEAPPGSGLDPGDEVVIYPREAMDKDASKALAEAFKAACGPQGANIVYDIVGGQYSEPALRAIAWEGRFLVVGFPAGIAKMPLNLTLLKSCDICGVFWGAFTAREPEAFRAQVQELFDLMQAGKIDPLVSETFPLARAGEAIAKLEAREAVGKLVVTME